MSSTTHPNKPHPHQARAPRTPPALREKMLALARSAIMHDTHLPPLAIKEQFGVFVSVFVDKELRGCIGTLEPGDVRTHIISNAVHAAYHDPRFPPLSQDEQKRMKVHVNLLTPSAPILYHEAKDLHEQIKGKGVIISRGDHHATFLPSVWEQIPQPGDFLANLCAKAGLPPTDWQRGGLRVETYESEEFSE